MRQPAGECSARVRSRVLWMVSGLGVQAAGLGGVTAFLWAKLRRQDIGGHITAATFWLMWHGKSAHAPGSTWGYASDTRSYTRRKWPNCTT